MNYWSDYRVTEDWTLKTWAPHVRKNPHQRFSCMPLWYITRDSGTLSTGLSESPGAVIYEERTSPLIAFNFCPAFKMFKSVCMKSV